MDSSWQMGLTSSYAISDLRGMLAQVSLTGICSLKMQFYFVNYFPIFRYFYSYTGLMSMNHFVSMIATAHARGFTPECVAFDSWYASLTNLKRVRDYQWIWLTRFKSNRLVNPDDTGN